MAAPIGRIFLDVVKPHLKEFEQYAVRFQAETQPLYELYRVRNNKFSQFLVLRQAKMKQEELITLLQYPLTRIPKYHYAFRQLLTCTEPSTDDFEAVKEFASLTTQHSNSLTQTMLGWANKQKMLKITNRVSGINFDLVVPTRRYMYEGQLLKQFSRGLHYRYFFLFSDMLMYCIGQKADSIKFKERYPFNTDMYVEKLEDDEVRTNGFRLCSGKGKDLAVYADSLHEKEYWCGLLTQALQSFKAEDIGSRC
eukprot:TRINITY_DN15526_c0_g1_i1.p1 TRINITY_DN15526_c0_g1~~TRINITY_DN15526_c0_g1_i1.p1  ORF type:complete len:288 (+),score=64.78 TRINITY_DN15526_c0_g1_i1:109-864(+)